MAGNKAWWDEIQLTDKKPLNVAISFKFIAALPVGQLQVLPAEGSHWPQVSGYLQLCCTDEVFIQHWPAQH